MDINWQIQVGDCCDILENTPDNSVDLVFADPPYNVGKDYGIYKDNLPQEDYERIMKHVIFHSKRISNNNIAFYVGGKLTRDFCQWIPDAHLVIVEKRAIGAMSGEFFLQYHSLFVTGKPNKKLKDLWSDIRLPGEGYFYDAVRYGHPGETPLKLVKRVVTHFTSDGQTVFDPYMGIGTTAIACIQTGRKVIGIELNPEYAGTATERIKQELSQLRLEI